ncbi:MAG: histidine--tRNA ligase [Candidatus Cloacimonadota bacterium]|nr:histidine--tRNA ligase [Candidatus Cloacimonadota bacterium]
MAKTIIKAVKGMRDFYPEQWEFQKWLSNKWLRLGNLFGYQEYETPILEPIELYLEKTSEEIVNKQTFTVPDRGGNILVMRPELTPSFARLVAQKEQELTMPIRWQSYGRFFRYEKPQRGRGRSFYQWNIDILGSDSILADAEMLTIASKCLQILDLSPTNVKIKISDRNVMHTLMEERLGIKKNLHTPLFRLIDKIDKMRKEKFDLELQNIGLDDSQIEKFYQLMNEKNPSISPKLEKIFEILKQNNVAEYCEIDLKIIRGFDYYTGTVFEAWGNSTLKRSLFGGGRYDNLTKQIGGKKELPGVGFAVGDMTMFEILTELDKMPKLKASKTKVLVTIFSKDFINEAIELSTQLRENNINTELFLKSKKLKKQFKYANKKNINNVVVIGEDEVKNNSFVLKNLRESKQETFNLQELIEILKE